MKHYFTEDIAKNNILTQSYFNCEYEEKLHPRTVKEKISFVIKSWGSDVSYVLSNSMSTTYKMTVSSTMFQDWPRSLGTL